MRKLSPEIYESIKEMTIQDNGLTNSTKLSSKIHSHFNTTLSSSLIRRYRRNEGFVWRRLRKSPYLTDHQKTMRLEWCRRHRNVDFSKHLFVDETTVRVFQVPRYHWRYPSSYPQSYPSTEKYRRKVNVWGGISHKGPTKFAMFQQNMDKYLYFKIIEDYCFPFLTRNFNHPSEMILHQDNDPKHTSNYVKSLLRLNKIN